MASLMGRGSRQTLTATLPPGQFHCLLDELPLHLIPRRFASEQFRKSILREPLFLNPHCSFLSGGTLPAELEGQRELLANFNLQGVIAWVRDPATRVLRPFWLGPRLREVISQLRLGEPVPSSLAGDATLVLAQAGILTPADYAQRRIAEWSRIVSVSADHFCEKGYVPIANLIHPFHIAALRRYYRSAIRRGAIRLGDEQSSRRYVAHNESVASFFHHQIANAVAAVAGEAIKPSYVYMASYLGGAELKKHIDREQCEFSVTLCLDFSPEPELATSWPIRLDTGNGRVTVYQALGDGLIYRGTEVPHYRSALREGHTSTSIFFHYVRADFAGPLN